MRSPTDTMHYLRRLILLCCLAVHYASLSGCMTYVVSRHYGGPYSDIKGDKDGLYINGQKLLMSGVKFADGKEVGKGYGVFDTSSWHPFEGGIYFMRDYLFIEDIELKDIPIGSLKINAGPFGNGPLYEFLPSLDGYETFKITCNKSMPCIKAIGSKDVYLKRTDNNLIERPWYRYVDTGVMFILAAAIDAASPVMILFLMRGG